MHREKPHKLLQVGVIPTPATNFRNLTAGPPTRVSGPVFLGSGVLLPVRSHQRVAWRQRTRLGAGNSRRAQAPGAIPAALTNFSLRPWSNISGIRLLNGTMLVGTLPAMPLPGGVKVARRFVKPHGVGASPTLAAKKPKYRRSIHHENPNQAGSSPVRRWPANQT